MKPTLYASLFTLFTAACAPDSNTPSEHVATVASGGERAQSTTAIDPELVRLAQAHPMLERYELLPLVELRRGARRALVLWPLFDRTRDDGAVSDDPMYGVTFTVSTEGETRVEGSPWNARGPHGEAVARALGGADFEAVGRVEGVPLESLPSAVTEHFGAFGEAVRGRDRERARREASAMFSLFRTDVAAFTDFVSELLVASTTGRYQLEYGGTERASSDRAVLTARVIYNGAPNVVRVNARPSSVDPSRWVIAEQVE